MTMMSLMRIATAAAMVALWWRTRSLAPLTWAAAFLMPPGTWDVPLVAAGAVAAVLARPWSTLVVAATAFAYFAPLPWLGPALAALLAAVALALPSTGLFARWRERGQTWFGMLLLTLGILFWSLTRSGLADAALERQALSMVQVAALTAAFLMATADKERKE